MKESVIVCDIDGVLGDVTPVIVRSINRDYGTNFHPNEWTDWDWPVNILHELAQVEPVIALGWLFSNEHFLESEPIPEAQEKLLQFKNQGAHILVATSRSPRAADATFEWLAIHYPFIESGDIFVRSNPNVNGYDHKRNVIMQHNPSLYFEDEAKMVQHLVGLEPDLDPGIIKLIDQPWNRSYTELDRFRTTWLQIDDIGV